MKRLLSIALLALAIFTVGFGSPALAGDAAKGAKLFQNNCSACHVGGGNVVVRAKTLKTAALEKYGMNSLEAITAQVTKGKNAMPAFGTRLKPKQIEDVATYVLEQAAKNWKG
ncbi:MAG: c-type cytochrome [Tychonema bourrellyi B0820]|uniref:Cytochrome c6 n=1 Tax=Tychonema bourrellyi FEM_GT703 TaxID=2040638 RepID=A0A2G4EXL8_9CYAN|nr:c-type cytochrome [Tychonema bourrellyi]MDQ2100128.1 c-type cytochrome [Tychonema bourrellyi B0820]PHX54284.1 cytochrome C6 [Tychonema bourrellyi FEM_GT703]